MVRKRFLDDKQRVQYILDEYDIDCKGISEVLCFPYKSLKLITQGGCVSNTKTAAIDILIDYLDTRKALNLKAGDVIPVPEGSRGTRLQRVMEANNLSVEKVREITGRYPKEIINCMSDDNSKYYNSLFRSVLLVAKVNIMKRRIENGR